MQIWQLFIILRQPVTISATDFSNPTKLTNDLYSDQPSGARHSHNIFITILAYIYGLLSLSINGRFLGGRFTDFRDYLLLIFLAFKLLLKKCFVDHQWCFRNRDSGSSRLLERYCFKFRSERFKARLQFFKTRFQFFTSSCSSRCLIFVKFKSVSPSK